ncbi:ABC transporter ATP-binding protein [Rothia uropygialis]|uniref:multidrug ABC transporter ATPase n=1 Tax=Kocuria sp. 36 TaxID=1415402 RepID=UPI00101DD80E|nr:multidrug ABC transporter ATPase [Kocuria sp. 36]
MLEVEAVQAKGRHAPLVEPTSFTVEIGELILVQANSQLQRSALSLVLTGRMRPDAGSVSWDGSDSRKTLRRSSSLIDSPAINEMENHMRVRDYVAEMLSYMPHKFLHRPNASRWLHENGLEDLDNLWDEQLTGDQRIKLMIALARHDQRADLLVFDTPSRHANHSYTWLPSLHRLARDENHRRAVVAVVPHISDSWHGLRATLGETSTEPYIPSGLSLDELFTPQISQEEHA